MNLRFGFIHEKLEIKIIILYILRRLPESISLDALTELALCDDGISYFDFSECLSELVDSGHVSMSDNGYEITGKGRHNGLAVENDIPASVREKLDKSVGIAADEQRRNSMIFTTTNFQRIGGCTVTLGLSDGIGPILTMEILAADEKQAAKMEKNFRANAESVFLKISELLDN